MLDRVCHSLAGDEVRGGLDLRRQALSRRRDELDWQRGPGREGFERTFEPLLGEHGRMEATCELAQLFNHDLELGDPRLEHSFDLGTKLRRMLALRGTIRVLGS